MPTHTFSYQGQEVRGVPTQEWSLEKTVAWLAHKQFPLSHPAWAKCAHIQATTIQQLAQLAQVHDDDLLIVSDVTANTKFGPLTYKQKKEIHTHHAHVPTSKLAKLYNTNAQNIRLAKRGEFQAPRKPPELITPDRPYGPLSIAEKEHIHAHKREESPSVLARQYNTSVQNIRIAQEGRFRRTQADTRREQHILQQAAALIGVDVAVLEALRNDNT